MHGSQARQGIAERKGRGGTACVDQRCPCGNNSYRANRMFQELIAVIELPGEGWLQLIAVIQNTHEVISVDIDYFIPFALPALPALLALPALPAQPTLHVPNGPNSTSSHVLQQPCVCA